MKISYSYGIMDLFHYGHLKALLKAKAGSDLHVVGLVSDDASRAWSGNIVSNEQERRSVLENIACVDWVMPQATLDPTDNLKKLHYIYPDAVITLFRGDDITASAAREYLKTIGGRWNLWIITQSFLQWRYLMHLMLESIIQNVILN